MTNERPKIVVFAYSEVGCVCLEELINDGANVALVFTHEDDPDENIWFRSVKRIAAEHGIPARTVQAQDPAAVDEVRKIAPDIIFSFYYRAMIPKEILKLPRLGAYNMHGALLPRYRGRACVNWAVLNGETETGATLHVMTEEADKGDIIAQKAVPILFEDTAYDVFLKVAGAARDILASCIRTIEAGTAAGVPQDETMATKFGRRRPQDGKIDWSRPAVDIYNLVRALTHPFPGAFTYWNDKKVYIWKALPVEGEAKPGEIVSRDPLLIGTGSGLLKILTLQADGETERNV